MTSLRLDDDLVKYANEAVAAELGPRPEDSRCFLELFYFQNHASQNLPDFKLSSLLADIFLRIFPFRVKSVLYSA
jgi:hypothetical protein